MASDDVDISERAGWLFRAAKNLSTPELVTIAPRAGLGPAPRRARSKARPRGAPAGFRHPVAEFCLTIEGASMLDIGEKCWLLVPPSLAIIEPGTPHAERFVSSRRAYAQLWFTAFSTTSVVLVLSRYSTDRRWRIADRLALRSGAGRRFARQFDGVRPITAADVDRLRVELLLIVAHLLRRECGRPDTGDARRGRSAGGAVLWQRHIPVLRRVREFMDEQYARTLCVDEIAAMTRLSPRYLSTIFRHWSGTSIHAYLTARRMEKAMRLCRRSDDLLVKEIARMVGYDDPLYFTKVFRHHFGRTPSGVQARRSAVRGSHI